MSPEGTWEGHLLLERSSPDISTTWTEWTESLGSSESLLIFPWPRLSILSFAREVYHNYGLIYHPFSSSCFCFRNVLFLVRCIHTQDCLVFVINWPVYHSVMSAFFSANVLCLELYLMSMESLQLSLSSWWHSASLPILLLLTYLYQ